MKKHAVLKYLVPLIMVFFFARNLIYVETKNLDSWLGGGMRMFGTVDKMLYRVCGFTVKHNDSIYFVNLKNISKLRNIDIKARIMPSDERLETYTEKIKNYQWCYSKENDAIRLYDGSNVCDSILQKNAIKNIEVYAVSYNSKTKKVNLSLINTNKND